jgi:hypothetical protein
MTAGSSSGSASSSSSSSSLGSRGGIVLPVTRLQSTNHVEKFSGMHGVMSAPVRERMLARALARATNFERDMVTPCTHGPPFCATRRPRRTWRTEIHLWNFATLDPSSREHAPTANSCKTEYCAVSLLVGGGHAWFRYHFVFAFSPGSTGRPLSCRFRGFLKR